MVLGGTIYSAMDGPGGPLLGGTTYSMTAQHIMCGLDEYTHTIYVDMINTDTFAVFVCERPKWTEVYLRHLSCIGYVLHLRIIT